jgi:hypothetical protein
MKDTSVGNSLRVAIAPAIVSMLSPYRRVSIGEL